MKIYIHYKITERPWGGGNSFLKGFRDYCHANSIPLAKAINDPYDILFFNGAHMAPGRCLDLTELIQQKYHGSSGWARRFRRRAAAKLLVYRADGFRHHYAQLDRDKADCVQRAALQLADHVVFQNRYTLNLARSKHVGFHNDNYSIVYNGVDQKLFKLKEGAFWDGKRRLRVFSSNWSANLNKGFRELAQFSEIEEVRVTFCGNWPHGQVDEKNVKVLGPMAQDRLAEEYTKHDVFLHVSKNDSSPNVCLEALSCGLPIIYHASAGIGEVAGGCGLVYNDMDHLKTLQDVYENYDRLVENILERRSNFSMERCGREYAEVFRSLLVKRGGDTVSA
ncbi:MAG: glycosyltransferase family 4 protein [Thermodesulfobacteriota bacterium]|nr:glycosyltransferase family 4 protein [Thermodesulfobacteriota bacterium]